MWIFTKYGFFSVVCAKDRKGNSDPNLLMVRARERHHLEDLCFQFELKNRIRESKKTDYRYRIIIKKEDWLKVSKALIQDIDYPNFKSEVLSYEQGNTPYQHALHEIWGVMYSLQENKDSLINTHEWIV